MPKPDLQYLQKPLQKNSVSPVKPSITGSRISVPVRDNRARLGTWQQIVVINRDNHARKRIVEVTISDV